MTNGASSTRSARVRRERDERIHPSRLLSSAIRSRKGQRYSPPQGSAMPPAVLHPNDDVAGHRGRRSTIVGLPPSAVPNFAKSLIVAALVMRTSNDRWTSPLATPIGHGAPASPVGGYPLGVEVALNDQEFGAMPVLGQIRGPLAVTDFLCHSPRCPCDRLT